MSKKQIISWCLFDFANSSYSAVIAAVIFPVYYARVIVGGSSGEGDLWWGRAMSLSMFVVALADHQGRVSSWGFGVGYAGSILSLLIALPLAQGGHFGLIWPITAAFFAIFFLPAFLFLPRDQTARHLSAPQ